MKILLSWLKDFVPLGKVKVEELASRLTMAGLEVEKIHRLGADAVFELEITPNRPDCLNMTGMAREISIILNKTLKLPRAPRIKMPKQKCCISLEDPRDCSRYIGVVVEGIRLGNAPAGIVHRLAALGVRGVNNIVDITNYVLLETGQPLHAFDYDKLIGGNIVVRRARKGERIITIDGEDRELDPSILVIADSQRPVAIAGIMGGKETEVTENTKNILLESAYFDPVLIRRGSRKLGLTTDASYHFERGVDYDTVHSAAQRTLALIMEHAGGRIVSYADVQEGKKKRPAAAIPFSVEQANKFLGARIPAARCKTIFKKLGCVVKAGGRDALRVTPPPARGDLKQAVDLYEELARLAGYNNLPMTLPMVKAVNVPPRKEYALRRMVAEQLLSQGLTEVVSYTMISELALVKTGQADLKRMGILNPLSHEQQVLRPSLLPSQLFVARTNLNRGQKNLQFFETGKAYPPRGEKECLGILMAGQRRGDWREGRRENTINFYDLKGVIHACLEACGARQLDFRKTGAYPFYEQGECAEIVEGEKTLGSLGKIKQDVLSGVDIKQSDVYFAEIDLEALYHFMPRARSYQPLSGFPAVTRDISIAVPAEVTFAQVLETIRAADIDYIEDIKFIEEYLGEKIPSGQKGLVFSLMYQLPTRTLTEEEVARAHEEICQALKAKLSAALR